MNVMTSEIKDWNKVRFYFSLSFQQSNQTQATKPSVRWYNNAGCYSRDETKFVFFISDFGRIFGSKRESAEGLTDHMNCGSAWPRPRILLNGVVESGLTQLHGSHTDPEAQAEQPGHDRTHLLSTSRGGINSQYIMFWTCDLVPPSPIPQPNITQMLKESRVWHTDMYKLIHLNIFYKHVSL